MPARRGRDPSTHAHTDQGLLPECLIELLSDHPSQTGGVHVAEVPLSTLTRDAPSQDQPAVRCGAATSHITHHTCRLPKRMEVSVDDDFSDDDDDFYPIRK